MGRQWDLRIRTRLVVVLVVSALLMTVIAAVNRSTASAADPVPLPACPLTEGTVLLGDGTDWGPLFLRADGGRFAAEYPDVPVTLADGQYDIVLASFDDRSISTDPQLNESWYVAFFAGDDEVYSSPPISDLPDDEELLVETVATSVRLDSITSIDVRHAAYEDGIDIEEADSVYALCASFVQAGFIDDDDSIFETDIEWMFSNGYTKGCNPPENNRYCPDDFVTRGQMAAFLSRALGLTERADDPFTDDDTSIFEADIERLAAAGITKGCNPPENDRYCPDERITRGQMAAFLSRALTLTDRADDPFVDDDDSVFEADIERIAAAGITKGCNPPDNDRYCPDRFVTRGQMAAFLRRGLS